MESKTELTQEDIADILNKMLKLIDDDRYTFGTFSTHMENPKNYTFLDDYPFRDKDRLDAVKLLEVRDYCGYIPNATDPDLPDGARLYVFVTNGYVTQQHTFSKSDSPAQKKSTSTSSSFFIRFSTETSWT